MLLRGQGHDTALRLHLDVPLHRNAIALPLALTPCLNRTGVRRHAQSEFVGVQASHSSPPPPCGSMISVLGAVSMKSPDIVRNIAKILRPLKTSCRCKRFSALLAFRLD